MRGRIKHLPGCSGEYRGDRGSRETQGDSLFVRWRSEDRPPSISVWMARCGGCLSTGADTERDRQAQKGDVIAERIGMLLGCEVKTAICT